VQGTDISKVHPPGGRQYQPGCQVNKAITWVSTVPEDLPVLDRRLVNFFLKNYKKE
jgi:hypothetical protein